jgi:hypothetical protein
MDWLEGKPAWPQAPWIKERPLKRLNSGRATVEAAAWREMKPDVVLE